jgi:hypothetical protein
MNKRTLIFTIIFSAYTFTYNSSLLGSEAPQSPLLNAQNTPHVSLQTQPCCCPENELQEVADGCCARSVCCPSDRYSDICCRLGSNRCNVCCPKTVCYMMCVGTILGGIFVMAALSPSSSTSMLSPHTNSTMLTPEKPSALSMTRETTNLTVIDLKTHFKPDSLKLKFRRKK